MNKKLPTSNNDTPRDFKKLSLKERKKLCIEDCLECLYCPHSESTIGLCILGLQKKGSKIDSYARKQKVNTWMGRYAMCSISSLYSLIFIMPMDSFKV